MDAVDPARSGFLPALRGCLNDDRTVIDARRGTSGDSRNWTTDFTVTYHRPTG
jgi:hypothetical protein